MRNIEIKARVQDIKSLILKAKELAGKTNEIIIQNDTFYNTVQGRLKLRKFEDGSSELIYYERNDAYGPKLSSYDKASISAEGTEQLNTVLTRAYGTKGIVKKIRQLFIVGQTRVHVDSVEGLGDFMELEVGLKPNESPEDGIAIAYKLMESLGVEKKNLVAGAYRDLMENTSE